MFARADRLMVERRYDEVIAFCRQSLVGAPRCVTLRLQLARALLAAGRARDGVAELEECLEIDPTCRAAQGLLVENRGKAMTSLLDESADKATTQWQPHAHPRPPAHRPPSLADSKPAPLARTNPALAPTHPALRRTAAPPRPQPKPAPSRPRAQTKPPKPALAPLPSLSTLAASKPPAPAPAKPIAPATPIAPVTPEPAASPSSSASLAKPVTSTRTRRPRSNPFSAAPLDLPPNTPLPRSSSLWMESRPPRSLVRLGAVAFTLVAIAFAWSLRHEGTSLPAAAVAAAAPPVAAPAPAVAAPPAPAASPLDGEVWIHPLAGPERRMPMHDSRLFGADRPGERPSECRGGHCGIDLAGRYGEPVFAVHDGVVERVQREANPDHGGHYVRIAHQGGTVVTQYFHLSVIPRRLEEGTPVKAGDVVGFVGLTGVRHSAPHLHFTIEARDPSGQNARYLDPEPLVALWPLRVGQPDDKLRLTEAPAGLARGFLRRRHRHHPAVATAD